MENFWNFLGVGTILLSVIAVSISLYQNYLSKKLDLFDSNIKNLLEKLKSTFADIKKKQILKKIKNTIRVKWDDIYEKIRKIVTRLLFWWSGIF